MKEENGSRSGKGMKIRYGVEPNLGVAINAKLHDKARDNTEEAIGIKIARL